MNIVKIKDKTFKTFIPEEKILESIKVIADRINEDMKDTFVDAHSIYTLF